MSVGPATSDPKVPYRSLALILLILSILSVALYLYYYFNTRWVLASPLIPEKVIAGLSMPYLRIGISSALIVIPAALQYRARRYGWSALISLTLLFAQQIAHSLI